MKRVIFIALIVIFSAVFLFSAYSIATYFMDSNEQQSKYEDLASRVEQIRQEQSTAPTTPSSTASSTDPSSPDVPDGPQEPTILPEYAELYEMNPDLVGWIKIDDTNINYPVMQTPDDKDYYLKRDFYKESSTHGCIYVREVCDVNAPSDNVTIYGHCMRDGTMFANLSKFKTKSFWEEHKTFIFDTLTERHTYEIIAVFKTTATVGKGFAYHMFVDAADEAEFDEFVATCKKLAYYDTGVTAAYGDKLICLSTCEYTQTNGRLVVVAKRIS